MHIERSQYSFWHAMLLYTQGFFSDVKDFYINWTFLPAMDEDIIRFHLSAASAKWYKENVNEQT